MTSYNYENFSTGDYEFDGSAGPEVGQKAPDFELQTSDCLAQRLLDFEGDMLVLELGSITCPLFQGRRKIMTNLADEFTGVSSAILYVREAHPGAGIPSHRTFDEKQACAARLSTEDGETRVILVDDFAGSAHQAYGAMPNAVYIINKNGCVLYRSDWNNPSATRAALHALTSGRPIKAKSFFKPVLPSQLFRTLGRAGKGSGLDFLKGLPYLIWQNLVKRNLRLLFGRPLIVTRDMTC